jgi:isopentenyl diphosphate isomerase/L-lactate dehydrogenase-like FMN-dependent dehydrogenase
LKFVSSENTNNKNISFNESMDKSLDWDFLKEIRKETKLPIILKGILSV